MFTHRQLRIAYVCCMLFICLVAALFIPHYLGSKDKVLLAENWQENRMIVNVEYSGAIYQLEFEDQAGEKIEYSVTGSGRFRTYNIDTSDHIGGTLYAVYKHTADPFNFAVYK